jgi:hypothetical protein
VGAANGSLHINLQESTKMLGVMYVAAGGMVVVVQGSMKMMALSVWGGGRCYGILGVGAGYELLFA